MKFFNSIGLGVFLCALLSFLPNALHAQWENLKGPEGGLVYQLLMNDGRLFAATQGGLYYSDDQAEHWQYHPIIPMRDAATSLCALNGKLYLISSFYVELPFGSGYQNRLLSSSDNGNTWTVAVDNLGMDFSGLGLKLLVIQDKLFLQSDNTDLFWTENEGQSWDTIKAPMSYAQYTISDQDILANGAYEGLYLSHDLGQNWTLLADTSQGYFYISDFKGSNIVSEYFDPTDTIFKFVLSTDFGTNWISFPEAPHSPGYGSSYEFWGANGDTLISRSDRLYFSSDFGQNWQLWDVWGDRMLIPTVLVPGAGFSIVNYGGVEKFDFATQLWTPKNQGLNAQTINCLRTAGSILFAKAYDQVYRSGDAGTHWSPVNLPSDYWSNQTNFFTKGDTVFLITYDKILFSAQYGASAWDTLGLYNYKNLYNLNLYGNYFYSGSQNNDQVSMIDARDGTITKLPVPYGIYYDFNDFLIRIGNRFIYTDNSGSAWISENQGQSWTVSLQRSMPGNNVGNRLFYLNNSLFLCTREGIFRSDDAGSSWTSLPVASLPQDMYGDLKTVSSMVNIGNVLFITMPYSGVYFSTDMGQSWHPFNDGLENLRGRCLATHEGRLFVGTSTSGVWRRFANFDFYSGMVFLDNNDNHVFDAGDKALKDQLVKTVHSNFTSSTKDEGIYDIYSNAGGVDTLRLEAVSNIATVTPAFYVLNASAGGGGYDFALKLQPNVPDLSIDLTNTTPFNRGFPTQLLIQVKNNGSVAQSPIVKLSSSPYLEYGTTIPAVTAISQDTLIWQLPELGPFEKTSIVVDAVTLFNSLLGSIVHLFTQVLPIEEDVTPDNNQYLHRGSVVASFDPNDKAVTPEGNIPPEQVVEGQTLTYTVRFQNTGNYPATFVRILDTLSENLDFSTLRILSASHDFTWKLGPPNVLDFYFDRINLPDSSSNAEGSHGFVKYSIQAKKSLGLYESIKNTAHIYFDFNEPVITNTTKSVVAPIVATHTPPKSFSLSISPNPARDRIVIQWSDLKGGTLQMINARAQLVLEQKVADGLGILEVPVGNLPAGTYTMQLVRKGVILSGQAVIVR